MPPPSGPRGGPSPVILLWALIPFIVLGSLDLLILRQDRAAILLHDQVAAWPETDGTVIESKVNTWERTSSSSKGGSRTVTVHGPDVLYRYRVGAADYQSRAFRPGAPPVDRERAKAEAIAARYPAGTAVKVRYDPDHPVRSWLENPPPETSSGLELAAINLVGLLLCLYNLYWMSGIGMLGERAGQAALDLRRALPWLPLPAAAAACRRAHE